MAINVFPAASSGISVADGNAAGWGATAGIPTWNLLQTWTLGGVNTFTFSGLSGYKSYKIITPLMSCGGSSTLQMRINGDSAFNYSMGYHGGNTSGFNSPGQAQFNIFNSSGTPFQFVANINQANSSGNKSVDIDYLGQGGEAALKLWGSYGTTSAVNSITIFNANNNNFSASNASANLVHLYGGN
jgi:hypothetical protein